MRTLIRATRPLLTSALGWGWVWGGACLATNCFLVLALRTFVPLSWISGMYVGPHPSPLTRLERATLALPAAFYNTSISLFLCAFMASVLTLATARLSARAESFLLLASILALLVGL